MKIISYDPKNVDNVPKFFNKIISESPDDKFMMFVFDDISNAIKNKEELVNKYETLMNLFNLPYSFYPYYIHFNRILPKDANKPNPRAHFLVSKKYAFDIISQPAYGMLILNLDILRKNNFKFNENYKTSFYIQDLIHFCFEKKLWISELYYLDVFESWKLFNNIDSGFLIPTSVFSEEKQLFSNNVKIKSEQINNFVDYLKKCFKASEPEENKKEQDKK